MSKTKFKPILDRVILEELEKKVEYGALITPDLGHERFMYGKVIAQGPGLLSPFTGERSKLQTVINDTVLFQLNKAMEISVDEITYYIIKEVDIETIIDKDEE
jgi:co-chaperonin GroES (HSP10)